MCVLNKDDHQSLPEKVVNYRCEENTHEIRESGGKEGGSPFVRKETGSRFTR